MKRSRTPFQFKRVGASGISFRNFQLRPERLEPYLGRTIRIWSNEHGAYWRARGNGYTVERAAAGTWAIQDAVARLRGLGPEKDIWFEFVEPGDLGEEARPEAAWHEDLGDVLWWRFPIDEAPWVGSPLGSDWPGYHTHWTPLPPMPHKPKRQPLAGRTG